jgi:dihydrofolate synthase/folylpolyglutamate synthase
MFGLNRSGDGISLHRALTFLASHGFDREWLANRSIIVTGTNGKGSTVRLLSAALKAAGLRVGMFTSPHLFDVRERIAIDDVMISKEALNRYVHAALAFNETRPQGDRMGAFELIYYAALLWFRDEAPDVIVWEAGIGGRYDAVRTARARLSLLTSVELEHTEILGGTEALIALDKIDALTPGGTLVLSPAVAEHLRPMITSYAGLADRKVRLALDGLSVGPVVNTPDGSRFTLKRPGEMAQEVRLSLIGQHQVDNALSALAAAEIWLGDRLTPALQALMTDAISSVRHAGRLERIQGKPELWIDIGHTPGALGLVADAMLSFVPQDKVIVVFGAAANKQAGRMAAGVAQRFSDIILTAPYDLSADVGALANAISQPGRRVQIERNVAAAARMARERAASEGKTVLAIGGAHLAAKIQYAWQGGDPQDLEFL